jgi:hypothetical protein
VYYIPGSLTFCPNIVWTAKGDPQLVATLNAAARSWTDHLTNSAWGGKYSIVAYNDAGPSPGALTDWVQPLDVVLCP